MLLNSLIKRKLFALIYTLFASSLREVQTDKNFSLFAVSFSRSLHRKEHFICENLRDFQSSIASIIYFNNTPNNNHIYSFPCRMKPREKMIVISRKFYCSSQTKRRKTNGSRFPIFSIFRIKAFPFLSSENSLRRILFKKYSKSDEDKEKPPCIKDFE